jgi:hypothetical protein
MIPIDLGSKDSKQDRVLMELRVKDDAVSK